MNIFNLFRKQNKEDVFNQYPDAMLIIGLDGRIIDLNVKAVELFGYSYNQMLDNHFSSYIDGGINLLNKISATYVPQVAKAKVAHDDDERFFEISASRDGVENLIYATFRDVTQQHIMQNLVNSQFEVAKKIIDDKNNYLINISGEILSSLASMEGFSKALASGVGGVLIDKQMKYVNIINKNATDLMYDLEKLFTLFRLESGKYQFDVRSFDLVNLLNDIAKLYEEEFEKKKMLFEADFSSLYTRGVFLDQGVCEYAIKCVLDAFLKHCQIGKVTFNAGNPPLAFLENAQFEGKISNDPNQFALFEIKANEFFLEDEELAELFDPYSINSKDKRPAGVKLAFVLLKKFITFFKGDVWVYSKPTYGTMIRFVLPVEKI